MPESAYPALAAALVGERLEAPADGRDFVSWLAAQGWDASAVRAVRSRRQADELPWPFPVAPGDRGGLGAAQFHALLAQARSDLGVDGLVASRRRGPAVLGDAERRLLAEKPPHHG